MRDELLALIMAHPQSEADGLTHYMSPSLRLDGITVNQTLSQRFNGQHGQAYLFDTVFNVVEASPEDRQMTTGLHRVRDISCKKCGQVMGWKYVSVAELTQRVIFSSFLPLVDLTTGLAGQQASFTPQRRKRDWPHCMTWQITLSSQRRGRVLRVCTDALSCL